MGLRIFALCLLLCSCDVLDLAEFDGDPNDLCCIKDDPNHFHPDDTCDFSCNE